MGFDGIINVYMDNYVYYVWYTLGISGGTNGICSISFFPILTILFPIFFLIVNNCTYSKDMFFQL